MDQELEDTMRPPVTSPSGSTSSSPLDTMATWGR
jgi:hypothetical protein